MKFNRFFLLLMIFIPSPLFSNTLYFPQVCFGGGCTTTFVIMNTGTTNVSSEINFYDQGGVNQVAYSAVINVPAGGSTRYSLPDTGPLTVVWGELAAGLGTVQGVATFDVRANNGALITTAGVLGLEAGNIFLLPVDVTPVASTGVAIANVRDDGSSVNVGLRLFAEDGSQVTAAEDVRLNPLGSRAQIASLVTELFPQLNGTTFKGTLVVEAAAGVSPNSLAATALTVKEGLLSALPVIPAPFPIYQSDLIKATVGQLGVAVDNNRVGLSITIENTSSKLVYLAVVRNSAILSDDQGTNWSDADWSGLRKVSTFYTYTPGKEADFTAIAPSERITVVIDFNRSSGGTTPGTTFSFAFDGTYYTSTGLRGISIGFPRIPVGQQPLQAPTNGSPVYQSDVIKATVGQLGVAVDNSRVGLSITIENISSTLVYLAVVRNSALLSDDQGTNWSVADWSGLRIVSTFYTYTPGKEADFTAIAPSERITVVIDFNRSSGGTTPGTTFSFAFEGTYYTSTGLRNVSIGLAAIKVQ